jgi:electron transport complex protein RnfA
MSNYIVGLIGIVIAAVFTNNIVLNQSIAICPFLGVSKKMDSALGMSVAVIFVLVISSLLSYIVYTYVLAALGVEFLQLIVFILMIAGIVQLIEIITKRFTPALYKSLGVYLPLITTNCAILGTANQVVTDGFFVEYFAMEVAVDALQVIIYALAIGIGFMLAIVLMAGVRERLERSDIPKNFKGFPITLLAAGLIAMAFYGLAGISF